jgi:hypothetical protein
MTPGTVCLLALPEQLFQYLFTRDIEMGCHIGENGGESTDAKRRMFGGLSDDAPHAHGW